MLYLLNSSKKYTLWFYRRFNATLLSSRSHDVMVMVDLVYYIREHIFLLNYKRKYLLFLCVIQSKYSFHLYNLTNLTKFHILLWILPLDFIRDLWHWFMTLIYDTMGCAFNRTTNINHYCRKKLKPFHIAWFKQDWSCTYIQCFYKLKAYVSRLPCSRRLNPDI